MSQSLSFQPLAYEEKWQDYWLAQKLFLEIADQIDEQKEKLFLLFAFAYPSGSGLHVGHVESKTALDILARFYRMSGKQVFFPVGWDAFGLPAENYAVKTGVPPVDTTRAAIETFRRQIKRLGISYDWATELATCHPQYYRWTQWLFLLLYKRHLAYRDFGSVNWCPSCQTVLANEQVVEGHCERCGATVIQKEMEQWFFRITKYQDELISGLDQVDWPASTKQQQLNWIGKSQGVEISFQVSQSHSTINPTLLTCFTTRIDTVFGVSFLAISPEKLLELDLISHLSPSHRARVKRYLKLAATKTEEERKIGEKDKTGVDTGLIALNPVNNEEIPIFVADYVLASYGTGVLMGVPAHDERDELFARKHKLPIKPVIVSDLTQPTHYAEAELGYLVNSGPFSSLSSLEAQRQIPKSFPEVMKETTNYKLRDWLISRQRYWGAPIPIIYDPDGNPHAIKVEALPWLLPTDVDYRPKGHAPLESSQELRARTEAYARTHHADLIAKKGWDVTGKGWRPEFDTMDTFVDSSWYYLRYGDARNETEFASRRQLERWQPVDFYMIGPEHIVLHLLYSRFFTKFLRDEGYLSFDEPFLKMRHQGMILGPDSRKMSKSKGNVISPDEIIDKFGADTLRVYEMFMGPIEADKPWDVRAVIGVYKFLGRVHKLVINSSSAPTNEGVLLRKLHQTIDKVGRDIPKLKFNTAIAMLMELVNTWESLPVEKRGLDFTQRLAVISLLAPFAPFLAEELYHLVVLNSDEEQVSLPASIHLCTWSKADSAWLKDEYYDLPVQINGRMRAQVKVAVADLADEKRVLAQVLAEPSLQRWLNQKQLKRQIYVPNRIVNLVVAD